MKINSSKHISGFDENPGFMKEMISSSDGAGTLSCIQCGTCSASCPVYELMDHPPRTIFALIKEGIRNEVLLSITPWICASCYKCTVNCPSQIQITEVMYRIKRICMEQNVITRRTDANRFYTIFLNQVIKSGRTHELSLMLKYLIIRHPVKFLQQVPKGISMMIKGFLPLFPYRIEKNSAFHHGINEAKKIEKV